MKVIGLLALALFVGVVDGNDCGVSHVSQCYNTLVHYEGLGFPLYGEDEIALDETCGIINDSFDCINSFVSACHGQQECGEECVEMITDIGIFSLNTGLKDLQQELCNPNSAVRETYLENYVCLEDNAYGYAGCHNDSQVSQEFMSNITDPKYSVEARCCFFSWYQDCFTNITRNTCGVNATFFVSFSLHKLVGHIAQHLCKDNLVICDRPPLPSGYDLDKDRNDLDRHKPDLTDNDIDNSVEGHAKANAIAQSLSVFPIVIVMCSILMSKHIFPIN